MAMFIPEIAEGAEVLGPKLAQYGAKYGGRLANYMGSNTINNVTQAHQLISNFSHDNYGTVSDMRDQISSFKNNYGDHPTKIFVDHILHPMAQQSIQQLQGMTPDQIMSLPQGFLQNLPDKFQNQVTQMQSTQSLANSAGFG